MRANKSSQLVCLGMAIFMFSGGAAAWGQETDAPPSEVKPAATIPKFRGRLPAYFSAVVNQKQRQQIYDVQSSFAVKISALRAQIAELEAERTRQEDAVLTPEQLEMVQRKRTAADKARNERASRRAAERAKKSATESEAKDDS